MFLSSVTAFMMCHIVEAGPFNTRIPAPAFKYEYYGAGNKVSLYETLCVDIFDRKVYMNTERFKEVKVHDMLSLG